MRNINDRIKEYREFMGDADYFGYHNLDHLGFFTAPASTRFHGAYEGGIVRPLFSGNGRACEPHGKARA